VHSPDLTGPTSAGLREFWTERHLCTLTTLRADGTPHVVPVGATLDAEAGLARVITSGGSRKAAHVAAFEPGALHGAPVAICQVDGARWSTLEGWAVVNAAPDRVTEAEQRYAVRYRTPRVNPARVVLEVTITRVLGNA
jgi:PPOX class probable F420-dependent enzyme